MLFILVLISSGIISELVLEVSGLIRVKSRDIDHERVHIAWKPNHWYTVHTDGAENVEYDFRVNRQLFLNFFETSENCFLKKASHMCLVNTK